MKRYMLFGSEEIYYARGGAYDYVDSSNSLSDLISKGHEMCKFGPYGGYNHETGECNEIDWWHIFDTEKKKIIAGTKMQAHGVDCLDKEDELVDNECQVFDTFLDDHN
jgi:hypothetical protein